MVFEVDKKQKQCKVMENNAKSRESKYSDMRIKDSCKCQDMSQRIVARVAMNRRDCSKTSQRVTKCRERRDERSWTVCITKKRNKDNQKKIYTRQRESMVKKMSNSVATACREGTTSRD
jgi:hypothetical protein